MHAEDAADHPEGDPARPAQVPSAATRVTWREMQDPRDGPHRYGVLRALLGAGIDAARIQVFEDLEEGGVYWVVTLDAGRTAILTDDTEEHVGHLEGPWPFKAVFVGPEGVRTKINFSIDVLTDGVITWYTEAAGPHPGSA
ncbi:hypothetical protein PV721_25940 [Streptomyces sp. MB09-01]|uniref:hypothetical protein n=1 Tax=Streptomyces sp. MB09-01 TaxID=3028666 RepID=UPI0029BF76C4|nr:hypothetical protein [Streptomyces sp. MB09-01]MDX3537744.1 hypothetical protein [Streptomyces sp. MB09-01]